MGLAQTSSYNSTRDFSITHPPLIKNSNYQESELSAQLIQVTGIDQEELPYGLTSFTWVVALVLVICTICVLLFFTIFLNKLFALIS
jgi:type VI protein secretion system component VasF